MAPDLPTEHLGDLRSADHLARLVDRNRSWQEDLDRLTDLVRRVLGAPVAQLNVVLSDRQRSLTSVARSPEWDAWNGPRSASLDASYCKHVIRTGEPLVIEDARSHSLVAENLATTEAGIRAYASVPLRNRSGEPLATLCVVDFESRSWSANELEALAALAELVMREVRGRMVAEAAFLESEARFRSLVENAADLITVLDVEGRITYQSPAYGRILGYEDGALEGTDFTELVHSRDVKRWVRSFFAPLTTGNAAASGEWRMRHREGSWRTVQGAGTNLLEDPAVRGIVLNLQDVSQKRQLEAELHQSQKMEAVGRLAGGVAHDFNNFLTAIRGNVEFLLAGDGMPEGAHEDLEEIAETAKRASGLTRQLLTFSRSQVLEMETLDLGEFVEEMVALVERLTGVNVELETSIERGIFIEADDGQLGQVIMNLAVNARDAMPEGGTLRLEARAFEASDEYALSHSAMEPGRYAMLVVADDGVGMSREVQARIFEPFFSTKGEGEGTGLGLSISWGIVEQMGGHIHLYSEPDRGTIFRTYFPRVERARRTTALESPEGQACPGEAVRGRVLVVEDEKPVHRVVTRVLESEGHQVMAAESAEEALALADEPGFQADLLLTDVLLPGRNGSELARALRDRWPTLAVVFTSGFSQGELESQQADLGNAAFLPKPFGPSELSEAVARAMAPRPGGEEDRVGA